MKGFTKLEPVDHFHLGLVAWDTAVVFTLVCFQTLGSFLNIKPHVDLHFNKQFKL